MALGQNMIIELNGCDDHPWGLIYQGYLSVHRRTPDARQREVGCS
jgi:hypothetical protein